MSPAMDLVLWEIKWYSVDTEWLVGECVFCPFETRQLETPSTTADLLNASRHECGGHDAALRHVVYVRSDGARGEPYLSDDALPDANERARQRGLGG